MNRLESVLALAERMPVFPCRVREEVVGDRKYGAKSPLTEHGFHDATQDAARIRSWWKRWPDALIGVPTGAASGIVVVDADPKGLHWLAGNHTHVAGTRSHVTRRGYHFLFVHPGEYVKSTESKVAPGIDVRGDGGYAIWWPGEGLPVANEDDVLPIPAALRSLLIRTETRSTPVASQGATLGEGERNSGLASLAGRLRRMDAPLAEIEAALLTFNDSRCVPPLDEAEVRGIAKSVARYPSADQPWARVLRRAKETIIADEENVRLVLEHDPRLQGVFRFDEFREELLLAMPVPTDDDHRAVVGDRGLPRAWVDADTVALQAYLQRTLMPKLGRERVEAALDLHARTRCSFHPLRYYLQGLTWDHVPRVGDWLRTYVTAYAQPAEYVQAVGQSWLISAVARVLSPGCQVDSVLVFDGPQGIGKTSVFRILGGDEHFSDSLPGDLGAKDARDHLRGVWVVELPELAQFRRSEIETVKAFISRREERFRPAYGRREITFKRQCVFAGTTNDTSYLVDTTGNRRFWPVSCGLIDLDGLRRDRDQLWAEAAHLYRLGHPWHLGGEIAALAASEAAQRVAHDEWLPIVEQITFELPGPEIAPGEVLRRMFADPERHSVANAKRVAGCLRSLGWLKCRRHMTRGQLYIHPRGMKHEGA